MASTFMCATQENLTVIVNNVISYFNDHAFIIKSEGAWTRQYYESLIGTSFHFIFIYTDAHTSHMRCIFLRPDKSKWLESLAHIPRDRQYALICYQPFPQRRFPSQVSKEIILFFSLFHFKFVFFYNTGFAAHTFSTAPASSSCGSSHFLFLCRVPACQALFLGKLLS